VHHKLRQLESAGVDQFNVYLMTHGQEETLRAYGGEIIPQFLGSRKLPGNRGLPHCQHSRAAARVAP